jgi:hypothetical protein
MYDMYSQDPDTRIDNHDGTFTEQYEVQFHCTDRSFAKLSGNASGSAPDD